MFFCQVIIKNTYHRAISESSCRCWNSDICKIHDPACNEWRIAATDLCCLQNANSYLWRQIMEKAGFIILIIGLVITIVTGLTFVTREKVVDIGKLEINANKKHSLSWSPVVGVVMMTIGAGVYVTGTKKLWSVYCSTRRITHEKYNSVERKLEWDQGKTETKICHAYGSRSAVFRG